MAELEASVAPKSEPTPDKELGFFGKIWRFIRQVIDEMKKVVYPTGEELKRYFIVVIVFVGIIMALVGLVDLGFGALTDLIFSAM
ncbi:preprotein translocase subunit SecE [Mobiluncus mulieris]|uniref:Protein translocase subunit SecE n=2 Tax=Mobiluncus mulieris TaxID=2052 RepID=E0QPL7_9ACTO|nr:preprotein translocase subunit SecE [Mobiluncus mulieris]EEJ54846.1 preprotein translocase, SecE subunit [Mobiluncus mulieris ATCC 35243]EEZ90848.1 preprotein translocase, SecE subunit [Mobiluncus mulieris 28-1]EFM46498.1 preprotein translocase, SecE subunit [Mobiluncus mulieris ATCC 35239]EFN92225.1 preprotein translocase, SecE subunit [Mobiluncus mulieris FB024-16]MBB5846747.1 preprotein translocase subunit SecE [Mobiluncus mulieris]